MNTDFLPIWLRKLNRVKRELEGVHWPSEQEGLQQALALMSFAIATFRNRSRLDAKINYRWISRSKKERERFFSC